MATGKKKTGFPWEKPGVSDRVIKAFNLRFPEPEFLKLKFVVERSIFKSVHAFCLDAVQKARDEGKAYVRILETGSVKAINAALSAQRYHVLHISCHAEPGKLILEKENGAYYSCVATNNLIIC